MRLALPLNGILALCACGAPQAAREPLTHQAPLPAQQQNFAFRWLELAQEAAARGVDAYGARPTVQSRQFAIWATAMYDAWAARWLRACQVIDGAGLRQLAGAQHAQVELG